MGCTKGVNNLFQNTLVAYLKGFMKVLNMFSPNRSRKKENKPHITSAVWYSTIQRCRYRRCTQKLTFTRMQLICYVRVQCIAKKTQGFCICVEQQYIGLYIAFPLEAFYKHLLISSSQTFVYSCIFRNSVSWIVLQNNRRNQSKLLVEKPFH